MYGVWRQRPPERYILSYFYDFFKACYSSICANILKLDKLSNFSVIFHVMGFVFDYINISTLGPSPFLNSEKANIFSTSIVI
jgi:hypothetical protein